MVKNRILMWSRWSLLTVVASMVASCEQLQQACDFECGSLAKGELTISGNPQVDGFFKALYNVQTATDNIRAEFEADVHAIAAAYGIAPEPVDAAYIAKVKTAIDGEFTAKLVGGAPQVDYDPPSCEANVNVAVQASAECRVQGGCQVDVECKGGELSFQCEGTCRGSCEGTCSVPVCEVTITEPQFQCAGECHGHCEATVNASCEGTCYGKCSGQCTAYDAQGNCQGQCTGTCQGSCVASVSGSCSGSCKGQCLVKGPTANVDCKGQLKCEGSCTGECSGGCSGTIKAPRCSTDAKCDVDAKCEAQASAQASAELQCRPPHLEIRYVFKPEITAQQKAEFFAKLEVLETHMLAISGGFGRLEVYLVGDTAAGIKPVLGTLTTEFNRLVTAVANNEVKIAAIRLTCVPKALQEAVTILGALPTELQATYDAQLTMMGTIGVTR